MHHKLCVACEQVATNNASVACHIDRWRRRRLSVPAELSTHFVDEVFEGARRELQRLPVTSAPFLTVLLIWNLMLKSPTVGFPLMFGSMDYPSPAKPEVEDFVLGNTGLCGADP